MGDALSNTSSRNYFDTALASTLQWPSLSGSVLNIIILHLYAKFNIKKKNNYINRKIIKLWKKWIFWSKSRSYLRRENDVTINH